MNNQDYTNHVIAAIIGLVVTAIVTYFRKIPDLIITKIIERQQLRAIQAGSAISNIITDLCVKTGALYVHIIRYHNGGSRLKEGHPVNMTVDWEMVGTNCATCINQCDFHNKRVRVQHDWENQPLDQEWFKIVEQTISNKHEVQRWEVAEIAPHLQEVWLNLGIYTFKEVFIKHKRKGFYTLGLSYCKRFKNHDTADGLTLHAAKQLIKLL